MSETKYDGESIKIGGREFTVPPLNLKGVKKVEPMLKRLVEMSANVASTIITPEQSDLMRDIVLVALNRNYPEMTADELDDILDLGNLTNIMEAVTGQSGFKKKVTEMAASR